MAARRQHLGAVSDFDSDDFVKVDNVTSKGTTLLTNAPREPPRDARPPRVRRTTAFRDMRSRDRGAVALAAAGVLARVLLAILGWTESASERLELASPVDALARIREGHALWGMGQSPYGGSALHAPPLYLALVGPLVANAPAGLVASVPFIVADLVVAVAIHRVATASTRTSRARGSDAADASPTSPAWVVAMFLANPFSIASCAAASSAGFRAAALAVTVAGAVEGTPVVAGAGCAALAYLGDPTCAALTVPSLARAMAREGGFGEEGTGKKGKGKGRGGRGRGAERVCSPLRVDRRLDRRARRGEPGGDVKRTRGADGLDPRDVRLPARRRGPLAEPRVLLVLLHRDVRQLSSFFLFAFDYFPVALCVPVVVRLGWDEPLFCVFVARLLCVVFSPYPTLGDASGYLALLPLFRTQLAGAGGLGYLVAAGYVASALLSPIMWRLWIVDRVANANFFFATTLAWMATQSALCVLCVERVVANSRLAKKKSPSERVSR